MRKIRISPRIEDIAKDYKDRMQKAQHLGPQQTLVNPLKKMKALKKKFDEGNVTELYEDPDTKKNILLRLVDNNNFSSYIQLIIDKYPDSLLDGPPSILKSIKSEFDSKLHPTRLKAKLKIPGVKNVKSFYEYVITALMYTEIRRWIFAEYVREIGIKTCCYCNANYAITDGQDIAYYDLDHWLPKSRYPYLCISFFNLQPSCHSCNHNKGDDDINEYFGLYEDNPSKSLEVFHFDITENDIADFLRTHQRDTLNINFKESAPEYSQMRNNMDDRLHITNIYKEHKDVVEEMIWKKQIYSPSYIETLKYTLKGIVPTDKDVSRFILGTYSDADDIHKRPLTKLIQDIIEKIEK